MFTYSSLSKQDLEASDYGADSVAIGILSPSSPQLHAPFPPSSYPLLDIKHQVTYFPSLVSTMVSVDVKHHVSYSSVKGSQSE